MTILTRGDIGDREEIGRLLAELEHLSAEERELVAEWASRAAAGEATREAALDVVAAERIRRAARESRVRLVAESRLLELGGARLAGELAGRAFERLVALDPAAIGPEEWEAVRSAPADAAAEAARMAVAAVRERAHGAASGSLAAATARLEELIEVLDPEERDAVVEDAVSRLASPSSSIRKLVKRVRRRAIGARFEELAAAVRGLAPEIRIADEDGTARFSLLTAIDVPVGDERVSVPIVAERAGGDLERLFLAVPAEEFVAEARRVLEAELRRAESAAREGAAAIEEFVRERAGRALYDVAALRKLVRYELHRDESGALAAALERIRRGSRKLDADAREKERVRQMVAERGLIAYREYFPLARSLGRELVLYAGPTNSGKTWHALNALVEGESGAYLAPLRLLALEGQEEIEKRGRAASFLTGEERELKEGARFIASTIEMLDTRRVYDAVVIDEVQLLTDPDRGWAWCQALVGAAAGKVYMTGSPDCIPLVQAIADYLGEPLTVHRLERHTPIEALGRAVPLSKIEPGTAVIAFSRRDVLQLKAVLEERFKVATIYGNLTPQVRREEARRFRTGEAEVLVATDAIAMGLNLPIRTVVFSTLRKWNGKAEVSLSPAEILQIGGRAGRFGKHERGYVGTLRRGDEERIGHVFSDGFRLHDRPLATSVRPGAGHIEAIAAGLGTDRLEKVLKAFQRGMTFDSPILSPGVTEDMIALAEVVDRYPEIPFATRLTLACAPIDTRNEELVACFDSWAAALASGRDIGLAPLPGVFRRERAATDAELHSAEIEAKRLTAYAWLGYRYEEVFRDLEECQTQRVSLDGFIERSLAGRTAGRRCKLCRANLPASHRHRICNRCYNQAA